jgi:kynureninase
MAPVPLYNNFEDIWRFGQKLEEALWSGRYLQFFLEEHF